MLTSAVSLLGGAACSSAPMGDADPATGAVLPAGPASAASSATPSPSTTTRTVAAVAGPAPLPAMARARTRKGAEAFVRHFLAEYNRAATSPTIGLLRPLSQKSCKTCAGLEEDVQDLTRDQQRFSIAPLRVDGVTCVACGDDQGEEWYVNVWVYQRKADVVNRVGKVARTIDAVSDVMQFGVRWVSAQWSVAEVKLVR